MTPCKKPTRLKEEKPYEASLYKEATLDYDACL